MTQRYIGRSGKQLLPLNKRITAADLQLRTARIRARRTVAEQLASAQRMWGMVFTTFFSRGFFGRLKWLLVGR